MRRTHRRRARRAVAALRQPERLQRTHALSAAAQASATLLVCAALFFGIHLMRIAHPPLNAYLVDQFGPVLRAEEAFGIPTF